MRVMPEDVEIVATVGRRTRTLFRRLTPILRRRGDGALLFSIRISDSWIAVSSYPEETLERSLSVGAITALESPIQAARGRVLVEMGDSVQYLLREESDRIERQIVLSRMNRALALYFESGSISDIQEQLDGAYMVQPGNLVVAVVRAGLAHLVDDDPQWERECVEDLARVAVAIADIGACRAHTLWRQLDNPELADRAYTAAQFAYEASTRPAVVLEEPVAERYLTLAQALSYFQELQPRSAASLPQRLVAQARSGHPDSLEKIREQVGGSTAWAACVTLAETEPRADVHARAILETLSRYAKTLYTLEISCDEVDRRARWRWFLSRMAGLDVRSEPVPWRAGKLLAELTRERLSLHTYALETMPRWLELEAGVHVGEVDLEGSHVDGACTSPSTVPPCMFVPSVARPEHRAKVRFALAHELAHLLIDGRNASMWVCRDPLLPEERTDVEKRANAFAAYYLAPVSEVREVIGELPAIGTERFYNTALFIGGRFGLSAVTAGEHLVNCFSHEGRQPLSWQVRERLRTAGAGLSAAGTSDEILFEEHEHHDMADDDIPTLYRGRYLRLLRRLVHQGDVSEAAARGLVGLAR